MNTTEQEATHTEHCAPSPLLKYMDE